MTNPAATKPLDGKIALVTGAGRGIGRAIAGALVNAGARVIAVARTGADLASLREELGEGALDCWTEDVAADRFIARVEGLSGLDILVNNAGGNRPQPMMDVTDESLDFILTLNVRAVYRTARAAALVMTRGRMGAGAPSGGAIINMSSQMGHVGSPGRTVYCMTKHAVEGLTKAMAVELAPHRIRVNSVAPTFVETPMTTPMLEDKEFCAFVDRMIPMGRLAQASEVASGVVFLASPAAAMITGHSLVIDGGWTAQ